VIDQPRLQRRGLISTHCDDDDVGVVIITRRTVDHSSETTASMSSSSYDDDRRSLEGMQLFEDIATRSIQTKEAARSNRCPRCWHDQTMRWYEVLLKHDFLCLMIQNLTLYFTIIYHRMKKAFVHYSLRCRYLTIAHSHYPMSDLLY
jgi:hypothetical protein